MLPKIPNKNSLGNIYMLIEKDPNDYVTIGSLYYEIEEGDLLIEVSDEGKAPGVHWSDPDWICLARIEDCYDDQNHYRKLGFERKKVIRVEDEKHYLELIMKYT